MNGVDLPIIEDRIIAIRARKTWLGKFILQYRRRKIRAQWPRPDGAHEAPILEGLTDWLDVDANNINLLADIINEFPGLLNRDGIAVQGKTECVMPNETAVAEQLRRALRESAAA